MKKMLVLALALFAGAQLNAIGERVVVEEMTTGRIATKQGECGREQGPFYRGAKGRCAEEHKIVCPACPDCPDVQCPACPICPQVTCEAKVVETCPVVKGCAVEAKKTCGTCHKSPCACHNRHHHHNRDVYVNETVTVQQPAVVSAPARTARVAAPARR